MVHQLWNDLWNAFRRVPEGIPSGTAGLTSRHRRYRLHAPPRQRTANALDDAEFR